MGERTLRCWQFEHYQVYRCTSPGTGRDVGMTSILECYHYIESFYPDTARSWFLLVWRRPPNCCHDKLSLTQAQFYGDETAQPC